MSPREEQSPSGAHNPRPAGATPARAKELAGEVLPEVMKLARAQAIEEAARFVEDWPTIRVAADDIAAAIRAKAKEGV